MADGADRQRGDLRYELGKVLCAHWLFDIGCDGRSNKASCSCGFAGFTRVANVGMAVQQWAGHVLEEMRPHLVAWRAQERDER